MKTRLAASFGAHRAAELAAAMLSDVWSVVAGAPGVHPVLATVEHGVFPIDVPPEDIWLQGDGDLGARIEQIVARALTNALSALALGADSPLLTEHHLQLALTALQTHDAVLGPCPDGGFYLLGLNRCPPHLFSRLPWSTSNTAAKTLERLRQHEFSVHQLPPLFDVDTADDLAILGEALNRHPLAAPATHSWYAAHFSR